MINLMDSSEFEQVPLGKKEGKPEPNESWKKKMGETLTIDQERQNLRQNHDNLLEEGKEIDSQIRERLFEAENALSSKRINKSKNEKKERRDLRASIAIFEIHAKIFEFVVNILSNVEKKRGEEENKEKMEEEWKKVIIPCLDILRFLNSRSRELLGLDSAGILHYCKNNNIAYGKRKNWWQKHENKALAIMGVGAIGFVTMIPGLVLWSWCQTGEYHSVLVELDKLQTEQKLDHQVLTNVATQLFAIKFASDEQSGMQSANNNASEQSKF
eukprot:TRINITY_DN4503_c0_g1_i1.p1 TRINITY_DN4503_c0_g1~~TRINITY_DN4503_c0_g1_i1.p1  ORF type:complete len:271 (-),score=107.87 TRINITY_DN4503_c0_g1_i1:142-954(-)